MPFTWTQIVEALVDYRRYELHGRDEAGPATAEDADEAGPDTTTGKRVQGTSVAFGLRDGAGPTGGYIRVWGPSADHKKNAQCHFTIARYNGAIHLRKTIARHVAHTSPIVRDKGVFVDPCGFTSGPPAAAFTHAISPSHMGSPGRYETPGALVSGLLAAMRAAGVTW